MRVGFRANGWERREHLGSPRVLVHDKANVYAWIADDGSVDIGRYSDVRLGEALSSSAMDTLVKVWKAVKRGEKLEEIQLVDIEKVRAERKALREAQDAVD